jgi:hypothetical protein
MSKRVPKKVEDEIRKGVWRWKAHCECAFPVGPFIHFSLLERSVVNNHGIPSSSEPRPCAKHGESAAVDSEEGVDDDTEEGVDDDAEEPAAVDIQTDRYLQA